MLELLVGKTAGEGYNGTFGGSIIQEVWTTDIRVDGCAGDYSVTTLHLGKSVFTEVEEGMDVGVEGFNPLLPRVRSS